MNREQILGRRIRQLTWLFVVGLFLSGATAIPLLDWKWINLSNFFLLRVRRDFFYAVEKLARLAGFGIEEWGSHPARTSGDMVVTRRATLCFPMSQTQSPSRNAARGGQAAGITLSAGIRQGLAGVQAFYRRIWRRSKNPRNCCNCAPSPNCRPAKASWRNTAGRTRNYWK